MVLRKKERKKEKKKKRKKSKIANFSHPRVFYATADGVPLRIGYWLRREKKTRMMRLSDG